MNIQAIYQTYLDAYEKGMDVVAAKKYALEIHGVPEKDRPNVSAILSGSDNWDKVSEIPTSKLPRIEQRSIPVAAVVNEPDQSLQSLYPDLEESVLEMMEQANEFVCPLT